MRRTRTLAFLVATVLAGAPACAGRQGARRDLGGGQDAAAARETLQAFARALQAGRFDEAAPLLSARWRGVYTPGRLALDFRGAGAGAREAAERVIAALAAGVPLEPGSPGSLRLPTGPSREAVLVAEGGSWRVDALE